VPQALPRATFGPRNYRCERTPSPKRVRAATELAGAHAEPCLFPLSAAERGGVGEAYP
jgi:hypothetical protein